MALKVLRDSKLFVRASLRLCGETRAGSRKAIADGELFAYLRNVLERR